MKYSKLILLILLLLAVLSAAVLYFNYYPKNIPSNSKITTQAQFDSSKSKVEDPKKLEKYTDNYPTDFPDLEDLQLDSTFLANGLVDLKEIDSTFHIDLKYASEDNFMQRNVYGKISSAYLQPEAAKMLARAQKFLRKNKRKTKLVIYDAARPQRVQFRMWEIVKGSPNQEYVAPPVPGSLHNFGCSVDVGLLDSLGKTLDMGTTYDSFDSLSQPRFEKYFLSQKRLTQQQLANRKLLRTAMQQAGFWIMVKEWWHFDAFSPYYVMEKYKIVK